MGKRRDNENDDDGEDDRNFFLLFFITIIYANMVNVVAIFFIIAGKIHISQRILKMFY